MSASSSNNICCFHWEDVVKQKGKEDQVQSVFLFSDTVENAIKMFEKKESEASTIRKALWDTIQLNEPVCLSESLEEVVRLLLYSKTYVDGMYEETDLRKTDGKSSKLYRFTPRKILYILAMHAETKEKPKKVELSLDDSLFD